jgi:hypothetical protein
VIIVPGCGQSLSVAAPQSRYERRLFYRQRGLDLPSQSPIFKNAPLWLGIFALMSCTEQNRSEKDGSLDAATPVVVQCFLENETTFCECESGQSGRMVCIEGKWQNCECSSAKTGTADASIDASSSSSSSTNTNKTDASFVWARSAPRSGSCAAGHYEGEFDGWYGPSIIVVSDLKVVPVWPVTAPGNPGFAFDLLHESDGEIFTVSNGKMNGNALGAPLSADIVGKLDCNALKFEATFVNGTYSVLGLAFRFEGPISADYDKEKHAMINGVWTVVEPDYPSAGGSGTWWVQWVHN